MSPLHTSATDDVPIVVVPKVVVRPLVVLTTLPPDVLTNDPCVAGSMPLALSDAAFDDAILSVAATIEPSLPLLRVMMNSISSNRMRHQ